MAKKSKKALGAAMAGVMAVGAVAGAANTVVTQVKADVASDVKAAHAKLEHLRTSLHNNYLGLKNQATWEIYAKEAQALINKLPNGSTKTTYQERLDRANAMILAAASVNHAEFSIQKNFPKADNANQWKAYAEKAMANVEKVEKGQEYSDRTPILVNRVVKVNAFADVVLKLEDAREAKDAKAMEALKEEAADLMTYFRDEMNYKDLMAYDLVKVIDQRIEEAGGLVEEDTEAPVLNVDGATEITVENGAEVKLPVVTATDNVDKEVKVTSVVKDAAGNELKSIDTKVAGVYTVTYSAEDAAGNKAKDVVVTVTVKEAKLAVESVNAINANRLVINFNKAIDAEDVKEIEKNGDRIIIRESSKLLKDGVQSSVITFSEDKKSATVVFEEDTIGENVKYIVSLVDNSDKNWAKAIVESNSAVLRTGQGTAEVEPTKDLSKFIIKYPKKMDDAATTTTNYVVYDEFNQEVGGTGHGNEVVSAAKFVDSKKDSVEITVGNGKLSAGKTYTIVADDAVVAADETKLASSKFTIKTPSVSEAKPVVKAVNVVSANEIEVLYDRDVTVSPDTDLFVVRDSKGAVVAQTSNPAASGNKVTLTATGAFEDGKSYTVSLAAGAVKSELYTNAVTDAFTQKVSVEAKAVTTVSAKLVRETSDKTKANLVLTFDQPVKAIATAAAGDVKIKGHGVDASLVASTPIKAYTKDATGKSLVIENVKTAFDLDLELDKTYEITIAKGKIVTSTLSSDTVANTTELKTTVAGIDVSAPEVKAVNLLSADKLTVKFDETIDASDLKASDIAVAGFETSNVTGEYEQKALSGSKIKYTVSGDTITITPANSSIKFVTGETTGVTNIVEVKTANAIKDVNGIGMGTTTVAVNADEVVDNAAPVVIGAAATTATNLNITYSENVSEKTKESAKVANQFSAKLVLDGVSKNVYPTGAAASDNVMSLTFGAGTLEAGKDYSKSTVTYSGSSLYYIQDAAKNKLGNGTFTGFLNSIL